MYIQRLFCIVIEIKFYSIILYNVCRLNLVSTRLAPPIILYNVCRLNLVSTRLAPPIILYNVCRLNLVSTRLAPPIILYNVCIHVNPGRSFGGTNGEPPSEASQLRKGVRGPPGIFKNLYCKCCNLSYS